MLVTYVGCFVGHVFIGLGGIAILPILRLHYSDAIVASSPAQCSRIVCNWTLC